jgi:hypothetical protein
VYFKSCTVDVKRDDDGSSATPDIPNAKGNSTFCANTGPPIVWKSTQKKMGFVVDFGPSSPFGSEDAIVGGARHSVSVTAMAPGFLCCPNTTLKNISSYLSQMTVLLQPSRW